MIKLSKTSKMPCKSFALPAMKTCLGAKDSSGKVKDVCKGCYAMKGSYQWRAAKSLRENNRLSIVNELHTFANEMLFLLKNFGISVSTSPSDAKKSSRFSCQPRSQLPFRVAPERSNRPASNSLLISSSPRSFASAERALKRKSSPPIRPAYPGGACSPSKRDTVSVMFPHLVRRPGAAIIAKR